jgi:hypothetical protein
MASEMIFNARGRQVCAFTRDGAPSDKPISIYPNAHDSQDSISICECMAAGCPDANVNDPCLAEVR